MKKLLIFSLLVFAGFTAQNSNVSGYGYGGMPGGVGVGGGAKEIQEGDKLHLCIKGEADAALLDFDNEEREMGDVISLVRAGTDLFKAGQILSIHNSGNSDEITLRKDDNGPAFGNADFVFTQNGQHNSIQKMIMRIFDRHEDFNPYIDFESEGSNRVPCRAPALNGLSHFVPSVYKIKGESFLLYVTEVTSPEAEPEDNAVNPEGQVPQTPQNPEVDPLSNPGLDNITPAPQSGGCNMSAALGGFNYGLSILFSLILGAHAVLRFRKK